MSRGRKIRDQTYESQHLGIVHASNYLKYMEHARVKLVEQQGIDLLAWVKKGVRAVVMNDTVNYRHPARYGDVLDIACRVEEIGENAVRFGYRIAERRTGREIVHATTTVVTVGPDGKPIRLPQEVREALGGTA